MSFNRCASNCAYEVCVSLDCSNSSARVSRHRIHPGVSVSSYKHACGSLVGRATKFGSTAGGARWIHPKGVSPAALTPPCTQKIWPFTGKFSDAKKGRVAGQEERCEIGPCPYCSACTRLAHPGGANGFTSRSPSGRSHRARPPYSTMPTIRRWCSAVDGS